MRVRHSIKCCLFALLCLLGSSQLAACGTSNTGSSQDTGIPPGQASLAGSPPLTLRDPSPSQLTVFVAVQIGGYDAVTRDKTTIDLLFSSKGRAVQFAGSEHLVCNGKALPLHGRPEDSQIAGPTSALEGQTFHCTYSAGHTSATLTFTVPHTPTISVPRDQARLPRSKSDDDGGGISQGHLTDDGRPTRVRRPLQMKEEAEGNLRQALQIFFLLNQALALPEALRARQSEYQAEGVGQGITSRSYRDRHIRPDDLWCIAALCARRLGHIQPGATERGIERHDAVGKEPANYRVATMACQVIPQQNHA